MANDGSASDTAAPRPAQPVLASTAFVGLLLIVLVGFSPFMPPKMNSPLAAASAAEGDMAHQIVYLAVAAAALAGALKAQGLRLWRALPPLLVLVEAWCLLSALWAPVADVALRRALLQVLLTFSVLLCADTLGPERAFRLLRYVLGAILIVNWLSIPLVPTAVHLPGEVDPSLVGDWRGLYGQKNSAGAVCVLTILAFVFSRNGKGNWIGWLTAAAALVFLAMTRSKTALGLLPVCLLGGALYRLAWRDSLGRAIFTCAAILILVAAAAAALRYADAIHHLLEDPTEFTGRAEIWQTYSAFARDHPWLGAGFGMLSNTGGVSVMHPYARDKWVETIGDSHNGYLQLFVTLGAVGFALALLSMIAEPLIRFWALEARQTKALLFALFLFFVAHNLTESDFLASDNGIWLVMLMVLAALRNPNRTLTPAR